MVGAVGATVVLTANSSKKETVADIAVGDCFNGSANDVDTVDCDEPHLFELFHVAAAPDPAAAFPGAEQALSDGGAACMFELVGYYGASAETDAALDHAAVLDSLLAVILAAVGGAPVALHAHGAAAGYVPGLAAGLGQRLQEVVLYSPWLLEPDEQARLLAGLPDTVPHRAGAHLCDAWQWERERHLLWPWMAPGAEARRCVAAPEPAMVHANVVELLRLGPRLGTLLRGATAPGLAARLRALRVPLRVVTAADDAHPDRSAALTD